MPCSIHWTTGTIYMFWNLQSHREIKYQTRKVYEYYIKYQIKCSKKYPRNSRIFKNLVLCKNILIMMNREILVCERIREEFFSFLFELYLVFHRYVSRDIATIYEAFDETKINSNCFPRDLIAIPEWSRLFDTILPADAIAPTEIRCLDNESIFHECTCIWMEEKSSCRMFREYRAFT